MNDIEADIARWDRAILDREAKIAQLRIAELQKEITHMAELLQLSDTLILGLERLVDDLRAKNPPPEFLSAR